MLEPIDASLVRIHTGDGTVVGAGFLVGERHVLTCAHVIAQALDFSGDTGTPLSSQVQLDFPQHASHTLLLARVVFWRPVQGDNQGDIAGLELLDEPPAGAKPVRLAQAEQVWDHPFRAFGFPKGYDDGVWATGRLLGRQGAKWVQLEDVKIPGFSVMSGFSGTPVWDEHIGGVVGMIVAASQAATTKTAFAIPSDVLVASWPQLASFLLPSIPRNPYKGLHAFTKDDTRYFFGRDALVEELATAIEDMLTREQKLNLHARLLTVLGPSGSGKSSVVNAGLIPYLQDGQVFDSDTWLYLDPILPGANPIDALVLELSKQFPEKSLNVLREDLHDDSKREFHLYATMLAKRQGCTHVVLMVDQFEEAFTLTTDITERQHFFDLLITAVTEPRGPLFVILTLRADFYDRPMPYSELYRLIDANHVSVLPLESENLRKVIEVPASLSEVQLTFEKGLVDELLLEMKGQIGALPLLQFMLDQLFERRDGRYLTLQAYHEMGGIKGALSQHAGQTYTALPTEEHRHLARALFLRLVKLGVSEQEQDTTRRRADLSEFIFDDPTQTHLMRETIDAFITARLLTVSKAANTTMLEVSHETVLWEWKLVTNWLQEKRGDTLIQQSLSEDVTQWEQHNRPSDRLYHGAQLKEAQEWVKRNRPNEREAAFLHVSAVRRIQSLVSLIIIVLLFVFSMGTAGWYVALDHATHPDPTLVTTLQDNVLGSLRYCIENANSGSTIHFASHLRGTLFLRESLNFLSGEQLTLQGPGADQITISGGSKTYANIQVPQHAKINISGLSFSNSETIIYGFIFNEGTLILTNSIISHNKTTNFATSYGGGIENNNGGVLEVINSTISNNSSSSSLLSEGGGIYNEGQLMVSHTTISNNSIHGSIGYGGGIFSSNIGVTIINSSIFSGNITSDDMNTTSVKGISVGGGIDNSGKLTITNSTFSKNTVISKIGTSYGGGIDNTQTGMVTVANSTFSGNVSEGKQSSQGGGIDDAGTLTVTNSTFSNNSAVSTNRTTYGGGIDISQAGMVTVANSTFFENIADNVSSGNSQGGGIDNDGKLTITNSTFSKNMTVSKSGTSYGGGINGYKTGTILVVNSTFSSNSSSSKQSSQGGGIYNNGKLTVIFSSLSYNTANSAGGIWTDPTANDLFHISNSIIAANSAPNSPDISGSLISGGYNLIESSTGSKGLNFTTDRQVAFPQLKLEPVLDSNGGSTQTLALLPNSPAIDVVPAQACRVNMQDPVSGHTIIITTDQRGKPRPDGSENACDIGAYESSY